MEVFFKTQNNDARLDWSRQKVGRLAHLQPKKTKNKKKQAPRVRQVWYCYCFNCFPTIIPKIPRQVVAHDESCQDQKWHFDPFLVPGIWLTNLFCLCLNLLSCIHSCSHNGYTWPEYHTLLIDMKSCWTRLLLAESIAAEDHLLSPSPTDAPETLWIPWTLHCSRSEHAGLKQLEIYIL